MMNSVFRNLFVWVILGSFLIFVFNNIENSNVREQISYSQFKEEILSDRIAKVVYKGDQMTIIGDRLDGSKFETNFRGIPDSVLIFFFGCSNIGPISSFKKESALFILAHRRNQLFFHRLLQVFRSMLRMKF